MEAIILAGGAGKRLQSVVSKVPKPMAPINQRPFLEILMDFWIAQGVRRFILAVGYKYQIVEAHFGRSYKGIETDYSVESEPLGTGGATLQATTHLKKESDFLVLNGDTFFELSLADLCAYHRQKEAAWTMALTRFPENQRYGSAHLDESGCVSRIEPAPKKPQESIVIGGVFLLARNILEPFHRKPESKLSLEGDILEKLLPEKRVYGYLSGGRFIDIGVPADYERAAAMLN